MNYNLSVDDYKELEEKSNSLAVNGVIYPTSLTSEDVKFVKLCEAMKIITTNNILKPEDDPNLTPEYITELRKQEKKLKKKRNKI